MFSVMDVSSAFGHCYAVIFSSLCICIISISFSACNLFNTINATVVVSEQPEPSVGYTAPLFHRDSIHSPYYNPNATEEDRSTRQIEASFARYKYLNDRLMGRYRTNEYVNITTHGRGSYMASLWLGTPPQETFLLIDTGSTLTWTQCQPCIQCSKQTVPVFEPTKSSTYRLFTCNSDACHSMTYWKCHEEHGQELCLYTQPYADGTESTGLLASDYLTFKYPGKADSTIRDMVFGCGLVNHKTFPEELESGVLGLGLSHHSITYIADKRNAFFSHCLGNATDLSTKGNLRFGKHARLAGDSSPVTVDKEGAYHVQLIGISIGSKLVSFPKQTINNGPLFGTGIILDTGSQLTFLHDAIFTQVSKEIKEVIDDLELERVSDPKGGKLICFEGVRGRETAKFPIITMHLTNADLVLDQWSMFITRTPTVVCSIFHPALFGGMVSIIGNTVQQFYNVGYNIREQKVWFERSTCSNLI